MHVLLISAGYPTSYNLKKSIFHQSQAEALAANGCRVGVVAVVPISIKEIYQKRSIKLGWIRSKYKKVEAAVYQYISIPKLKKQWLNMPLKKGKKEVIEYIERNGVPDFVHLHSFQAGYLALWVKQQYGVKVVVTEHSSRFYHNTWSQSMLKHARFVFENCDFRIAVSPLFSDRLNVVFNLSFSYLPNCVDTDFFKPFVQSETDQFMFVCVASFNKNKNQQLLVNAFEKTFLPSEKVSLVFCGQGENKASVERLVKEKERNHQVDFVGDVDRIALRSLLNKSKVLLSSSKVETFGITLIEAMSMGVPVLSTKSGGPQTIITQDYLGFLVDGASMGDKMREIYSSYASYDPIKIRAYAVENYSSKNLAKKLVDIYQSL